jgi:hypothetical protein
MLVPVEIPTARSTAGAHFAGIGYEPESERVILIPTNSTRKGTTTIDWFVPSADGAGGRVALLENGSESRARFVFMNGHRPALAGCYPARAWHSDGGGSAA